MSRVTAGSLFLATGLLASSADSAAQPVVATALPVSGVSGCESLPSSLVIDPKLRPLILDMLRRAPTFRRQLMRLVGQPDLVVTVAWQSRPTDGAGARTRIIMEQGRVRAADVEIRVDAGALLVELVAHEFEHILEQLDGIDLVRWIGRSGVHRVAASSHDEPIETERARRMGRIVAGEYAAARSTTPSCGPRS